MGRLSQVFWLYFCSDRELSACSLAHFLRSGVSKGDLTLLLMCWRTISVCHHGWHYRGLCFGLIYALSGLTLLSLSCICRKVLNRMATSHSCQVDLSQHLSLIVLGCWRLFLVVSRLCLSPCWGDWSRYEIRLDLVKTASALLALYAGSLRLWGDWSVYFLVGVTWSWVGRKRNLERKCYIRKGELILLV